ncbi:MAG: PHP domain-containing protein, partial [Desulfurellaceae bacterium]|nr:PHP domain-containing protein [Desulfurellaceae bacterium]
MFVHLHNHTEYSLLDGATKIKQMFEKARKDKMKAVAITDHGNMFGTIEFYKTAKASSIKPIIGIEAYVASDLHNKTDKSNYHLTLWA